MIIRVRLAALALCAFVRHADASFSTPVRVTTGSRRCSYQPVASLGRRSVAAGLATSLLVGLSASRADAYSRAIPGEKARSMIDFPTLPSVLDPLRDGKYREGALPWQGKAQPISPGCTVDKPCKNFGFTWDPKALGVDKAEKVKFPLKAKK